MKNIFACLTGITLCFFFTWAEAQQSPEKAAQPPAEAWLKSVDGGKYAESWTEAAELFKKAVTQQQWESALQQVRTPLGKLSARKLKSANYTKTIPGAPAGEYVMIIYDASFEKLKVASETITMMLEKDNKWKTAGYFIK